MNRLLLIALAVLLPANYCHARTWTDATGQHQVDATYESTQGNYIYLRVADARRVRVLDSRLSDADREYVAGLQSGDDNSEILPIGGTLVSMQLQQGDTVPALTQAEQDAHLRYPFYVYYGHCKAQHLAGKYGTAVYWQGPMIVAPLVYHSQSAGYYFYEVNYPGQNDHIWAFGKHCIPCKGFPVWRKYDYDHDGHSEWRFYYYAKRKKGHPPH